MAYDFDGNIDDWKQSFMNMTSERPKQTLEEVENEILDRYYIDIKREEL